MSAIKDGGSAFPCEQHETLSGTWNQSFDPGMTLRDYFAAKCVAAMVGTINSEADYNRCCATANAHGMRRVSDWFASESYKQADAMLRAREVQS